MSDQTGLADNGGPTRRQRLTRPYTITGGRTTPSDDSLAIESLVEMTWRGYEVRARLPFEKGAILGLTEETLSVAEVAAHLEVPLGVARVLVGDLADEGFVVIHPPGGVREDGSQDPEFLERVLSGLKKL